MQQAVDGNEVWSVSQRLAADAYRLNVKQVKRLAMAGDAKAINELCNRLLRIQRLSMELARERSAT